MIQFLMIAAAFVIIFVVALRVLPGGTDKSKEYTRRSLNRLETETAEAMRMDTANISVVRHYNLSDNPTVDQLLRKIPGMEWLFSLHLKSGLPMPFTRLLLIMFALLFVLVGLAAARHSSPITILLAAIAAVYLPIFYMRRRITKRTNKFTNMFPDAVDMIVRSVRSGHPIQAALRMIAENMDPPVSSEFKQVIDDITVGRTVPEALLRLANRLDQPDITFFVVVVAVQQETGGNLAEVLSNLSSILRRRKQLRLKIRAISSEGRMTAMILGALPILLFGALTVIAPDYLKPLFEPGAGQFILGTAGALMLTAFIIVRKLVNMKV